MDLKEKTYLTVGLFVLIAAVGITYTIAEGDDAYFCEVENTVGLCFKLSKVNDAGLQTRCYYNSDTPTKYNYCKSGWFEYKDPTVTGVLVKIINGLRIEKFGDIYQIYVLKEQYKESELDNERKMLVDLKTDYEKEIYSPEDCLKVCEITCEIDMQIISDLSIEECMEVCEFGCDAEKDIFETQRQIDIKILEGKIFEIDEILKIK